MKKLLIIVFMTCTVTACTQEIESTPDASEQLSDWCAYRLPGRSSPGWVFFGSVTACGEENECTISEGNQIYECFEEYNYYNSDCLLPCTNW